MHKQIDISNLNIRHFVDLFKQYPYEQYEGTSERKLIDKLYMMYQLERMCNVKSVLLINTD